MNTDTALTRSGEIESLLVSMRDEEQAKFLMRFFRTGKGDYGEGDLFLGLRCPQTRSVVNSVMKDCKAERDNVGHWIYDWEQDIERLLYSPWHEVRLCGFLLMTSRMDMLARKKWRSMAAAVAEKEEIVRFYLAHCRQANNWDLVDMSCPRIVGHWLSLPSEADRKRKTAVLDTLSGSNNLWEQRISLVSSWMPVRSGDYFWTQRYCEKLLYHPHDLIQKATGWMLRELGKQDEELLLQFLDRYAATMPRTALRYAIEKLDPVTRREYLDAKGR